MGNLSTKIIRIGILGVVDDRALIKLVNAMNEILHTNIYQDPPNDCKLPEELKAEVIWD